MAGGCNWRLFGPGDPDSDAPPLEDDGAGTMPVDLEDGLLGHWKFNGLPTDYGDGRYPTIPKGSDVQYVPDRFGRTDSAVRLNGAGQYIEVKPRVKHQQDPKKPISDTFLFGGHHEGLSLSVWFNALSDPQDSGLIWNSPQSAGGYELRCAAAGLTFFRHDSAVATVPGANLQAGWNHVVVSWDFDSEVLEMWINGALNAEGELPRFNRAKEEELRIGGSSTGTFHGDIDQVRVYGRALNDSEVKALFDEE